MAHILNRRSFLARSSLAVTGLALPWWACQPMKRPDFTVAFLTDMHVDGYLNAPEGFARALQHAMAQPQKPDFLITGGDLAYDTLGATKESADAQYEIFQNAIAENVDVPVHHTIGNHDCLGVYERSGVSPDSEFYGKKNFLKQFNRVKTYEAFTHKGWRFALLDTVNTDNRNYRGHVDAEQIAWLEAELSSEILPTVLAGHIPFFSNYRESSDGGVNADHPKETVHNANEVVKIFDGNEVRMVLAGHLHINESWRYRGTEYANLGAVSGAWWRGPRDGCEEGYTMLEFTGDHVRWSYVDYGWEPPPEAYEDREE